MGSATSTFGLIQRIKQGDREAFTPLFEIYRPRLAVFIHYRLSPQLRAKVEVDDLLQETLFEAYKEFGQFDYRGPGSFLNWLSRIAEHVIIDEARFQGRNKRRAVEMLRLRSEGNPGGPEPVDTRTPSRLFAQSEGIRRLLRNLDELPVHYREAILLSKFEGLATREMAERLGKSPEEAALLLHRALKRFRQLRESGVES
jgi:RNA polymerase sigma-70 factor (ECF subfamily)